MNPIDESMSLEEVAAAVSTALARHGIRAVLSGGAVVSIYSGYAYESKDLDFIIEGIAKDEAPAMKELGFRKESGRYWTHPGTEFWVEFPSGPLQVGDARVDAIHELVDQLGFKFVHDVPFLLVLVNKFPGHDAGLPSRQA